LHRVGIDWPGVTQNAPDLLDIVFRHGRDAVITPPQSSHAPDCGGLFRLAEHPEVTHFTPNAHFGTANASIIAATRAVIPKI
jgi:hypothetical protein